MVSKTLYNVNNVKVVVSLYLLIWHLFADSDVDYLPFVKLRNTTNVVKKDLSPADDTTSTDIDVPFGFAFGNISLTTVYVWLET